MSLSGPTEPEIEPKRISLERPENSGVATLPIQPDRASRDLLRMGETPHLHVYKLVAQYPRLEALITAKGASTKNRVKGLNTYVNI